MSAVLPSTLTAHAAQLNVSTLADRHRIEIGQSVRFFVTVDDLGVEPLDSLGATIVYDAFLLGPPVITQGEIVPSAADFFTFSDLGVADASYLTIGPDFIDTPGTFFTFDVVALAAGTGVIQYDFAFGSDVLGNSLNLQLGPPLAYVVSAIPEPSAFLLLLVGAVFLRVLRSRSFSM